MIIECYSVPRYHQAIHITHSTECLNDILNMISDITPAIEVVCRPDGYDLFSKVRTPTIIHAPIDSYLVRNQFGHIKVLTSYAYHELYQPADTICQNLQKGCYKNE